jgi:putative membrane protein
VIDYDPHDWFSHFWDLKGSMVREILGRVLSSVIWSVFIVLLFHAGVPLGMPSTIHSLVGIALGLLLVFRTNSSNERFWEARKLWGALINECRILARQANVYLHPDPQLQTRLIAWTAAFPHALRCRLHGDPLELGPAADALDQVAVRGVLQAPLPLQRIAQHLSQTLQDSHRTGLLTDQLHTELERSVSRLQEFQGGCERIHSTPLPFAYVVHLRRLIILYCFSLPFALVREFGWFTVLDTLFVAYTFFGIEEIGVEIENPFGHDDNDLPLARYCAMIDRDLLMDVSQ